MRTGPACLLLIGLCAVAYSQAQGGGNVSGKWVIERTAPNGNVQRVPLEFNQVQDRVDGSVGGFSGGGGSAAPINNEVYDGKMEGQTLSFYVWRGADRPVRVYYKGTLNPAGDEIAFTVTGGPVFGGGGGGGPTPGPAASTPAGQASVAVRPSAAAAAPVQVVARRVRQ